MWETLFLEYSISSGLGLNLMTEKALPWILSVTCTSDSWEGDHVCSLDEGSVPCSVGGTEMLLHGVKMIIGHRRQ